MKKFLALVLALVLSIVGTTTAVTVNTREVADRCDFDRFIDWLLSYLKSCRKWHGNIVRMARKHTLLKRILLAPLSLFIGTASAEGSEEAKPITNLDLLGKELAKTSIPKKVVAEILKTFSVVDMRKITSLQQFDKLKKISGIGEKRAEKIMALLTGRFPNPMDTTRRSNKISKREESIGFSLMGFEPGSLMKEYEGDLFKLDNLRKNLYLGDTINMNVVQKGRVVYEQLKQKVAKAESEKIPFRMKAQEAKINRMSRSIASDIFQINYDSKRPTDEWITVSHGIQEKFNISPWFCGPTQKKGAKELERFQKQIERRLGNAGVVITMRDGTEILYKGFAASASHQKKEKLVMAKATSMEKHEEAIWFAMKMDQFLKLTVNGAAIWKMRANLLRPIRCQLKTKSGRVLTINDLQIVPDIVVTRHIVNARTVGIKDEEGNLMQDHPADVEKTMADGTIMYTGRDGEIDLGPLENHGQLTGYGEKGKIDDCRSPIAEAARLEGKPIPNNLKPLIAGEGVWKFDKTGMSWEEFVQKVNELAKTYPGINNLYLIREGDELEEDVRIRRLTRSLIQQWIHLSDKDIDNLTMKSRKFLKKLKTLQGAVNYMAENSKNPEDRSDVAKIFNLAPWLVMNPAIKQYLEGRFTVKQNEAASNKLKTEGTYPYIQEDLVAVAQIWVFGADPSRMDLGVLKEDEISVADAPNGHKVLAVRFPANYQTAVVRTNRSLKDVFASCPSTCMISFYDDLLIRQDGDVDGDEIAIILNKIAIRATEDMHKEFNPPVIVFAHGGKPAKEIIGTEERLIETMYDDLWKAKKYDGVGKYANLATLCCHFASLAYAQGKMAKVRIYLNQMSLASTGAILSIDQVKGNDVSEDLIERLDEIGKEIGRSAQNEWKEAFPSIAKNVNAPARPMPYTQQFVKKLSAVDCMGPSDALCDKISSVIINDTGKYELDTGDSEWNAVEAKRALLCFPGYRVTSVRKAPLSGTILSRLADNWFNDKNEADQATFELIRAGKPVSQKDLLLLLWRNACALEFRMEGENLKAKKKEYYRTVREILYTQACSTRWVSKDGYEYNEYEKKFSVVNSAVSDALCLVQSNGLPADRLGSYAIFVLKVFAKEILWCLERSNPDPDKFKFGYNTADDLKAEERAKEIEELYSEEEGVEYEPDEPDFPENSECIPDEEPEDGIWYA